MRPWSTNRRRSYLSQPQFPKQAVDRQNVCGSAVIHPHLHLHSHLCIWITSKDCRKCRAPTLLQSCHWSRYTTSARERALFYCPLACGILKPALTQNQTYTRHREPTVCVRRKANKQADAGLILAKCCCLSSSGHSGRWTGSGDHGANGTARHLRAVTCNSPKGVNHALGEACVGHSAQGAPVLPRRIWREVTPRRPQGLQSSWRSRQCCADELAEMHKERV